MTTQVADHGWARFARRWNWTAGFLGLAVLAMSLAVRATRRWPGWDVFDPWTIWIPTAFAGSAVLGLVLGLWAYVVRPEGRWTRWGASLSLFAMVPGAYIVEWSSRHPGFGAVEIAATVVLAMGLLVLFLAVVGLPVRGLLAVVDRRRRRHDRPTLGEWAVAWLRSKQRLQILAVLLVAMSSLWLLVATFLPVPGVQRGGAMGAFVHVLRRLGLVANDLAIGVAAAGVVMWFQEDRFWSRDSRPSPLPRRAGRRTAARTRRLAKRWASRS